jgi:hypothetical protein
MAKAKQLQIYNYKATVHLALVLLGLGYSSAAFAYLDPGTGSIILQGLIAGVMVVVAAWGIFWQRIKLFVSSLFFSTKSTKDNPDHDSDK